MQNLTVRNYANTTIFNVTVNAGTSSQYWDIGLPIVQMSLHNKFDVGVIFHLSQNSIITSFPMAGGDYFSTDVATGTYTWWVTYSNGTAATWQNGTAITGIAMVTGPATIDFGWIKAPTGSVDTWAIMAGYIVLFAVLEAVLAIVVSFLARSNTIKKAGKSSSPSKEHVTSR
jgi:hypothetical protein